MKYDTQLDSYPTLTMTLETARELSHAGDCTADVHEALDRAPFRAMVKKIDPKELRTVLREWGAWGVQDLTDHRGNCARLLWIAACDIREEAAQRAKGR